MEEINKNQKLSEIKRNTIISTLSLFIQSGYSGFLGLVANLVITILLSPTIFGIYITVLSLISVLNYFSDIGLAASLVQKREITEEEIKTTFTMQQILIITIILIGFFMTSFIKNFYNLPQAGVYLYWSLLLSFFISSLKTIPSILLERHIQFQKIVLVQIIEATTFYITVIILAIFKQGLNSFTIAVFLRAIIGLITIYSLSFWVPKIGISIKTLKELLSFGVPFQASSFLALFKDDLMTLFLGKLLGFQGLGYIGWAKKWAEAPIRIIMDNVSRVLFPVIARIQNDKEKVEKLIDKILNYQTTLLAPVILGLALTMNTFVAIIPKYGKWSPALPYFYLFCVSAFASSYSTPFINLFNALGKVKTPFAFMLFWTALTWVLTPPLTKLFGLYGFPINVVVLSLTFIIVVHEAKKIAAFDFIKSIYKPIISSLIMGLLVFFLLHFLGKSYFALGLSITLGGVIYFLCLKILFQTDLLEELKLLFSNE